jgi:hypothetical protein
MKKHDARFQKPTGVSSSARKHGGSWRKEEEENGILKKHAARCQRQQRIVGNNEDLTSDPTQE